MSTVRNLIISVGAVAAFGIGLDHEVETFLTTPRSEGSAEQVAKTLSVLSGKTYLVEPYYAPECTQPTYRVVAVHRPNRPATNLNDSPVRIPKHML